MKLPFMPSRAIRTKSTQDRKAFFLVFIVLFIVAIPIVIFLAMGYRVTGNLFNGSLKVVSTGGISLINVPEDADVFINYRKVNAFSVFRKSFFIQNLLPGEYFVAIAQNGKWSWAKHVTVEERRVTYGYPFLLAKEPHFSIVGEHSQDSLITFVRTNDSATSTATAESNPEFERATGLFADQVQYDNVGSALMSRQVDMNSLGTPMVFRHGNVMVWREAGALFARWMGRTEETPDYFCSRTRCSDTVQVYGGKGQFPVKQFAFLPGKENVLLVMLPDGLYALEIDRRPDQNLQPVYLSRTISFRTTLDTLYVREGSTFFRIQF